MQHIHEPHDNPTFKLNLMQQIQKEGLFFKHLLNKTLKFKSKTLKNFKNCKLSMAVLQYDINQVCQNLPQHFLLISGIIKKCLLFFVKLIFYLLDWFTKYWGSKIHSTEWQIYSTGLKTTSTDYCTFNTGQYMQLWYFWPRSPWNTRLYWAPETKHRCTLSEWQDV